MRFRPLGTTGLQLSVIGLGGHWRTDQGGRYYDRFDDDEVPAAVLKNRREVVAACLDAGINYVDITTGAECLAYGLALTGCRDRFLIGADDYQWSTRNPECCRREALIANVERCLARLRTDYLDIWRVTAEVHGHNTDAEVAEVLAAADRLRQDGKIRFLGLSSHSPAWIRQAVERFAGFEAAIVPCTPLTMPAAGGCAPEPFRTLAARGVGIMTIKPFAGGLLFSPEAQRSEENFDHDALLAGLTLRHLLHNRCETTSVLAGMNTPAEVHDAVRCAGEPGLSAEEMRELMQRATGRLTNLPPEYAWLEQWHCLE